MGQAEGVADGHDPLAWPHRLGIAERQGEELALGLHPQQRDVGLGIATHDLGRQIGAVFQPHGDAVHVLDDVVVGHDVAVLGDHETGPEARHELLALGHASEGVAEGGGEELLERMSTAHRPLGADVHDTRRDPLGQVREGCRHPTGGDGFGVATSLLPEGRRLHRGGRLVLAAEEVDGVGDVLPGAHLEIQGAHHHEDEQGRRGEEKRLGQGSHGNLQSLAAALALRVVALPAAAVPEGIGVVWGRGDWMPPGPFVFPVQTSSDTRAQTRGRSTWYLPAPR
jgi:hypothetical protein